MYRDDRNDGETTSLSDTFSEIQVQLSNDREDFSGTKWRGQARKNCLDFAKQQTFNICPPLHANIASVAQ